MGLFDGLGKWLKNEFDQITGQPAPQPTPVPQPAQQPWHPPMAIQQPHAPAPLAMQPQLGNPQPPQSQPRPPQINIQPNPYPNVDPQISQTIQSSIHLNPQQKVNMLQRLNNDKPVQFNPLSATVQTLGDNAGHAAHFVGDAAQSLASPFAYLGKTTIINPAVETIANFSNDPYLKQAARQQSNEDLGLGTNGNDIGGGLRKLAGNATQVGLDTLAPGVDGAVEKGITGILPNAVPSLVPKAIAGATTGAAVGAPYNVASYIADTQHPTFSGAGEAFKQGAVQGAVLGGATPLAGAAIAHVSPILADALRNGVSKTMEAVQSPALQEAERTSGLPRTNVINDNEAGTLRDFADYKTGGYRPDVPTINKLLMQTRNAAQTAGVDVNTGSPAQITDRIYNYLRQRQQFINAHDAIMQGGYIGGLPSESVGGIGDGFKYKNESDGGTRYYNTLNEDNSFQDINGVRHPVQSNATFYVANYDGTGETRAFKVNDISSQNGFNSLIKKYGSKGNLLNVEVDESPALNKSKQAPTIKIDRTKLTGKALEKTNAELTTSSGTHTETPAESSQVLHIRKGQDSASLAEASPTGSAPPEGRAIRLRELGLPDDLSSYSDHTPKRPNGANLSQDEINRLVNEDVANYTQNQFPTAGGLNMKPLTDREMRETVLKAKRRSDAESANVVQRHAILDNAIRNGVAKGEDRQFFEAIEHPEKINEILQNVRNPDKFMQAVTEMRNFNDFAAKRSAETGTPINYRQNYLRHNVDLSDPEQLARYLELAKARGRLSTPGYAKERIFNDLNDLERNGFNLKYNNARDLAKDYANSVSNTTSRNALVNHLKQNVPGHITTVDTEQGMIPTDMNGREFVTGRSNGLQRTFMSPQLSENVARYVEPIKIGKVAKSIDTANQALKQSTLALGGFHDLNVTKRYVTQEIASGLTGEPKRLLNSVVNSVKQDAAFWSKDYFTHELERYRDSGLLDRATHDGNLTLNNNLDAGSLEKAINGKRAIALKKTGENSFVQDNLRTALQGAGEKAKQVALIPHNVNEFIHEFLFGRKIPLMKLQTLQSEMERAGIPLKGELTLAQHAKLVALTDQINNMYGGINKGFIMKSGAGKYIQRQLMLAPDFTGGNLNSVAGMVHGGAKSLAWRQNMGNYLSTFVMASVATGLVAAASGHDGAQAAEEKLKKMVTPNSGEFLTPSIDLPYTDSKGNKLVVNLPGSPLEEAAKIRDPAHFLISRGASLPKIGTELATNQNYYGQPLVDPYQNPNPTALDNALAVAGSVTPIPVANGIQLTNGKQNAATTVLNTAGLRVSKDQSDPKVQQAEQYFDQYNQLVNALNPNERAALQVVQPTQKDRNGNYVVAPTVFDTPDKAETLLRFPNVLNGMTALNRNLAAKGQSVDPFYTELTPDQQRAVLTRDTINKNNTQQLTAWNQQNQWYKQFQQDRSVFYNSLPPTDPNKPKNPIQPPVETPDIQALYSQSDQITDPKTKAQFYAAHPELTSYQQEEAQYINKVLSAQGLTPLKLPPVADKDTESYMSTYMAASPQQRQAMKQGNPNGYNKMEAYMQNVSEYEVAKNGALDQLQGQTPNQNLLKGINSLASYDMLRNPDGSYSLKYGSVNPGATGYGSVSALPQQGASQAGVGGHSSHKKAHHIYMKPAKRIRVFHPRHEHKVYLNKPVSPIKIKNRVNKHVGINRTTYL